MYTVSSGGAPPRLAAAGDASRRAPAHHLPAIAYAGARAAPACGTGSCSTLTAAPTLLTVQTARRRRLPLARLAARAEASSAGQAAAAAATTTGVDTLAAQKDATLAGAKRAEESAAAGVVSWRPPLGGDPPPPPGEPWAARAPAPPYWSLNWDPVVHDADTGELQVVVGSCPKNAEHVRRLATEAGAQAILCVQSELCFDAMGIEIEAVKAAAAEAGVLWAHVAVRDFDRLDQANQLPEMVAMLATLVGTGRRVYVHCTAGINRATLTVVAWLSWARGVPFDDALALVKRQRPQANPYRLPYDIATARLLSGQEETLYLLASQSGCSQAEGGDWVARDLGAARAALLKEHFARRAKANLQLLSSADALASQCSLF